ncbi:nitrate reductase molybdenum cofactor assembly chaperone [Paenibacillus sp. GCM10028914]|uniref:nitrate reductase molybdenum cofactor assembly chaperone n=1 Tax=Paenibacillus sp. GCM10028914 TaxID=3273416 RepID=UPI00361F4A3B
MNDDNRLLLAAAARMIGYPSSMFHEEMTEIENFAEELLDTNMVDPSEPFKQLEQSVQKALSAIGTTANKLKALSLREAQEQYVATFDLKDRTGLYLTAHELGDSRRRGVAMLELREHIRNSGFQPIENELPDYVPLLYEWIAAAPEHEQANQLIGRIGLVTERIRQNLPDHNPYRHVFEMLMNSVFETPAEEAMKDLEQKREKPDTDPMPFPLMY